MKKICLAVFAACSAMLVRAQAESDPFEIATEDVNESWYASPWVWVAGAALIIVLLVLLSRGRENKQ